MQAPHCNAQIWLSNFAVLRVVAPLCRRVGTASATDVAVVAGGGGGGGGDGGRQCSVRVEALRHHDYETIPLTRCVKAMRHDVPDAHTMHASTRGLPGGA